MFSISEKKALREEFWNNFKTYSNKRKLKVHKPGKWIMNDTGIKGLSLKFVFDEVHAWAGIEISSRNIDKQVELFDKFEKLKSILEKAIPHNLTWELEAKTESNVAVSRIGAQITEVNIYNKECWKEVNPFLYSVMAPIEDVFREYFDFLKYQ
jgi:hypothetical protein